MAGTLGQPNREAASWSRRAAPTSLSPARPQRRADRAHPPWLPTSDFTPVEAGKVAVRVSPASAKKEAGFGPGFEIHWIILRLPGEFIVSPDPDPDPEPEPEPYSYAPMS